MIIKIKPFMLISPVYIFMTLFSDGEITDNSINRMYSCLPCMC